MRKILVLLAIIGFAAAAHAQLYKWVDKDGKTRYGDTPPAGVKATALGAPASGSGPAAAVPAAAAAGAAPKDAKKGPLTPAEQAQEYRKRQEEEKKASAKADSERQAQAAKAEDCARAREYLRTLESGQRIARTNAAGERYFMDETQTAQELAKSQQSIQQTCTN
ncbi:MAG: DUF4124 domain-containing protein [Pseudomonadota bacterium]